VCALDSCPNEIEPDFDEDDGQYWTNPPEGWFAVYVLEHDKPRIELEFCSREHLAERMSQPLPPPPSTREEEQGSWLGTTGLVAVLLTVLAVFLVGVVTSVRLLAGLA
jgi:hypothetical protein